MPMGLAQVARAACEDVGLRKGNCSVGGTDMDRALSGTRVASGALDRMDVWCEYRWGIEARLQRRDTAENWVECAE